MKAYIKYTKRGKIIPGSLILRPNNTPPSDGVYKEVQTDLCCDFDPRITLKISCMVTNKPYDGNNLCSPGGFPTIISGILPQDIGKVGIDFNYFPSINTTFVSTDVGNHIGVIPNDAFVLTGPSAYKYKYDPLAIFEYADIYPANVYIVGLTPQNKPYDGNTTATWTGTAILQGTAMGDNVSLVTGTLAANFNSPSIGINKAVYITGFSITGPDAYRYTIPPVLSIGYANITP